MPDHAEISALCRSVLGGCIMPEIHASIWTKPQVPNDTEFHNDTDSVIAEQKHRPPMTGAPLPQ